MSLFYTDLDTRHLQVREIEKMGRKAVDSSELFIDGLPVPMRSIATLTGLAPDRLARAVTELELRGLARRSATGVQSLGTNR